VTAQDEFDQLTHEELGPWASANDVVAAWIYDTDNTRRILRWRKTQGMLVTPEEYQKENDV
jgi:hypothetical protein